MIYKDACYRCNGKMMSGSRNQVAEELLSSWSVLRRDEDGKLVVASATSRAASRRARCPRQRIWGNPLSFWGCNVKPGRTLGATFVTGRNWHP